MRNALNPKPATIPVSLPFSIPAPTGGWNARDALASMPLTDAEIMDNWFPETTNVITRPGTLTYCSAIQGGQVETLFSYAKQNTVQLLCAAGNQIYQASTVHAGGTINSASTIAVGFSNNRWQYVNIGSPGGSFMVSVNGVDHTQIYDGTNWFAQTINNSFSSITASNVAVYNFRLFYTEANTLRFAYHQQTNAIGGTISAFDLAGLMPLGGYLVGIDTWTRDAGNGPDDYIVFISSRGECAVYQGTNPGDATVWSMVGIYRLPAILGPRCTVKFGGDLLIATEGGVFPLSAAVSGPLQQQSAVSDKIRNIINTSVKMYRSHYGWELKYYPGGHWLILNVPVTEGAVTHQYVMNTNTGAWCRFLGVIANTFQVYNNNLYFGSTTKIIQHDQTGTSFQGDDGASVSLDVKQASSSFDLPGRLKHFKLFRPQISSDGDLPIMMGIDIDFSNTIPSNVPSPIAIPYSLWDVSDWDTFYWADDPYPQPAWQGIGGLGTYGAVRMVGSVNAQTILWNATDIILEPGEMV